jgi:hypothetical protein
MCSNGLSIKYNFTILKDFVINSKVIYYLFMLLLSICKIIEQVVIELSSNNNSLSNDHFVVQIVMTLD